MPKNNYSLKQNNSGTVFSYGCVTEEKKNHKKHKIFKLEASYKDL